MKIKDNIDLSKYGITKINVEIDEETSETHTIYNHCLIAINNHMIIDEENTFKDLRELYIKLKNDNVLEED